MAKRVIHVSEEEAASDFASLTSHVRAGEELIIESNARPLAIVGPAAPEHCTISECSALLPEDSTATIDPDFAKDVEAAVESHRKPLTRPHGTDTGLQH